MALLKSTYARRKGTGRKPKHVRIRHRAVHTRRHRRFRGIHGAPTGSRQMNLNRAAALRLIRRAAQKAAQPKANPARKTLLRSAARAVALKSVARAAAMRVAKKRVVAKGLKRRFLGRVQSTKKRAYNGRKVPPGLKRKFNGRTPSKKPRVRKVGTKVAPKKGAAISAQSYINMF